MDITQFIPDAYGGYRSAIRDAFTFFLEQVPHLRAVRDAPPAADDPGAIGCLLSIAHASPTLHKLAQLLARNRHLAPELRRALQTLESREPRTPIDHVFAVVREELSDSGDDIEIGQIPLAEASVAVVAPFVWRAEGRPQRGVLKVLKPDVRRRLTEELAVWSTLGDFFNERCHEYGLPDVDYRQTFDSVAQLLLCEIDLRGEQSHLAQAREALQLVRGIIVPRLLPWCTPRITAMERIDGLKVTEMDTAGALEFGRIARNVVHGLVAQPLFSLAPSAMFHADPHAGNLMLTGDGDVAVLDWALVGRLSVAEREQLAQIILGAVMLDPVRVCRAIDALCLAESASGVTPRTAALRRVVDAHLGTLRANGLPTAASITRLLDEAITRAGALFSKDVLHFRKATLMLEGVIADLGGDLDAALRSAAVEQLAMEWPARMISPPHLRTFGTRLSTIELTAAGWSIPLFLATRLLHTGQ